MSKSRKSQSFSAVALAPLFQLDRSGGISLQDQIRRGIVNAVGTGVLPEGSRLPSSRKLADRLGISRNTALLAYQTLIADGHLVSRERSGVFVANDAQRFNSASMQVVGPRSGPVLAKASARLKDSGRGQSTYKFTSDWQSYRYPFLSQSIGVGSARSEDVVDRCWRSRR